MTQFPSTPPAPPTSPPPNRAHPDAGALQVLVVLNYVYAGVTALGSCFGLLYVGIGAIIMAAPPPSNGNGPPPAAVGGILAGFGLVVAVVVLGWALLSFLNARYTSERKNRTFCLVASSLQCLGIPLGTALGIFGLVMLTRPRVKELFEGRWQPVTPPAPGAVPPNSPPA